MKLLISTILILSCGAAFARSEWNPPARYDAPFAGKTVLTLASPHSVPALCDALFMKNNSELRASLTQKGCAWVKDDMCEIIAIDVPAYSTTPEAVIRHERGHCNGWPSDHPS